jgi:DUF917 family protein
VRYIDEAALADIAVGAAILGTGGGGNPRLGYLIARNAIRQHGPVPVVGVDELTDDAFVVPAAMMGAPAVASEKLPSLGAMAGVLHRVAREAGAELTHTMPIEIGGIAALLPIAAAAEIGVPLVDADLMGRAFPEIQMVIPSLFGVSATPMSIADEWGNTAVLHCDDNGSTERIARALCTEMGGSALIALYALTAAQVRDHSIRDTLALAQDLGSAVAVARAVHSDPIDPVLTILGGYRLFSGKVVDLDQRTTGGFTHLEAHFDGTGADAGARLVVQSQNEHLVARRDGTVVASTPDLIMLLDALDGSPITTDALRYGARAVVVGAPCDPRYRSRAGLAVVGPRAFGHDHDYVPVEELVQRQPA